MFYISKFFQKSHLHYAVANCNRYNSDQEDWCRIADDDERREDTRGGQQEEPDGMRHEKVKDVHVLGEAVQDTTKRGRVEKRHWCS